MIDWKRVTVADLAAPNAGALATGPFGSSIGSRFFRTSGVPVLRGSNLSTDSTIRLNDHGLVFLAPDKASEFTRSTVRNGDIVFTSWGTVNQIGLVDSSAAYKEYVISNKQMKLTPNPSVADSEFLYYTFSSPAMQREILEGSIGSSVPGFNLARLKSLELILPPLGEQKRIALAISDAERTESTLSALITKKLELRSGVLDALITGKHRIAEKEVNWRTGVALNDVVTKFSGYWGGMPGAGDLDVRIIRAGDVSANNELTGFATRSLTKAQASRASCRFGDVILTTSGTIGNVALIGSQHGLAVSNFVRALRPGPHVVGAFLFYLLQTSLAKSVMASHLGVSAMPNLGSGFFKDAFIRLPSIQEQHAIAEVLSTMDAEIELLRKRRCKAKAIKTGMMQQLLSGLTRLPAENVS